MMVKLQAHAIAIWKRRWDILTYAALTAWLLFVLFPLYWIFTMSLKQPNEVFSYPPKFFNFEPTLDNYLSVIGVIPPLPGSIQSDFLKYFSNSLMLAGGAIVITVILGTTAAYGLARFEFAGREPLALLIVAVRLVPLMTILLPLYIIYQRLGLYNTYPGLMLAYLYIGFPFYTWLIRGYIAGVPREIEEAAVLDGCSTLKALYYVVFPVIMPGIVSAALLVFIYMWNNFVFALILSGANWSPVPVGIFNYTGYSQTSYTSVAAASVISVVPVIIIGIFIQKYIVQGLSAGAVKA